jgi:membrane-bound lytic murein transglycosylase F
MRAALIAGRADMAAAQITPDAAWLQAGLPTQQYDQISQLVVQSRSKPPAHDLSDLGQGSIVVRDASPQLDTLRAIKARDLPDLTWIALKADQRDPIEVVTSGDADFAIVDANEFEFARHLYPDAVIAFTLTHARSLQWVVRAGELDLLQAANGFFVSSKTSGQFAAIASSASSESEGFDYLDAHRFQNDIAARLPQLQAMFQEAAQTTGLDWRLLAAVGYQESKWQTTAASADGARGIMMLTSDTAGTVGVKNRLDQWQNILGGARYLAQVIDSIPSRVGQPDRTWMGLAAYNVGYGHLEDARVLAQLHGKDPDSWKDVRSQLPLLAQEQYYARAKRGYARGWEPARFVESVRQYLAVLEWTGTAAAARLHATEPLPLGGSSDESIGN